MDREILFRGFHEEESGSTTIYVEGKAVKGEWVYGAYSPYNWTFTGKRESKPQIIAFTKDENDGCWAYVIPSTVSQYTGLDDKNGKKIFNGDIVLAKGVDYKAVIEWQQDACRFLTIIINRRSEQSPDFLYTDRGTNRGSQMPSKEVIGTIFDKELEK